MRGPDRTLSESFWLRSRLRLTYLIGAGRVVSREELDRRLDHSGDFQLLELRDIARDLKRLTEPGSQVWVQTPDALVYWLAERQPATRFVQDPGALVPEAAHVTTPLRERELRAAKPDALVLALPETGRLYRLFDVSYVLESQHGNRGIYLPRATIGATTPRQKVPRRD